MLGNFRPEWVIADQECTDKFIDDVWLELRRRTPSTSLAVLGHDSDFRRCERWIRRGARCYVCSSNEDERLIHAIKVAHAFAVLVIDAAFVTLFAEDSNRFQPTRPLRDRELQILEFARDGLRSDEIGAMLHLTSHTVEFHIRNLIDKLGARNRTQAVARAIHIGLIASG